MPAQLAPEPVETPAEKMQRVIRERAAAKAAAKAKAAASRAAAKAVAANKKKAASLKTRMANMAKALRAATATPLILEVPRAIADAALGFISEMDRGVMVADAVISGDAEEWPSVLDSVPFTDAKKTEQVLVAMLKGISKMKK